MALRQFFQLYSKQSPLCSTGLCVEPVGDGDAEWEFGGVHPLSRQSVDRLEEAVEVDGVEVVVADGISGEALLSVLRLSEASCDVAFWSTAFTGLTCSRTKEY